MRKRNMLIPAVILMATLLSAGCTAGSTQGVTETAVQAESAVEENTDENAETKALQASPLLQTLCPPSNMPGSRRCATIRAL